MWLQSRLSAILASTGASEPGETMGVESFSLTYEYMKILHFPTFFKIKWPKSGENLTFGGRWVAVPMNPPPPKQDFVATPLGRTVFLDDGEKKQGGGTRGIMSL